jgi:cation diffusion facilitator family transporter
VTDLSGTTADQRTSEKVRVARLSAVAATGLLAAKAIVGWQTGSLAILSEAAHSGIDLIATLLTLFAVRVADRPADRDHHYGHGKVENLSALVETGLLLATCLWIISEGVERVLWKPVDIQPTWAAFGVVIASIIVDLSRSRALARTAAATGSQALEADALNFRTDVWSSLTVLLGLAALWAGRRWDIPRFALADAVAGILVAAFVLVVGGRLGKRAVDALLDRAPLEVVERIRAAIQSVPEVRGPTSLRVRTAGAGLFVDAAISIERGASFEGAHEVVSQVEERIRDVAPLASVVIHAEPVKTADESLGDAIRLIVSRHAVGAHDMFIYEANGTRCVDVHLELPGDMSLVDAHGITERIEADLRREYPRLGPIRTHVDPVRPVRRGDIETEDLDQLAGRLTAMACTLPGIRDCRNLSAKRVRGRLWIFCVCAMDRRLTLREAHELGLELGRRARQEVAGIERFTVHAEPEQAEEAKRRRGLPAGQAGAEGQGSKEGEPGTGWRKEQPRA